MTAQLRTERHAATLVLSIDAPAASQAASARVASGIVEVLAVAESDAAVRCVLLQGAGGVFGAGLMSSDDAAAAGNGGAASSAGHLEPLPMLLDAIRSFPKPVIAVVEGRALDAGFSLALACDLIVAAEDATFGVSPNVRPAPDLARQLARALPRSTALDWLWQPAAVRAPELERRGLVARITPRGQALAEARAWADRLAQRAADTISATKETLRECE